LQVNADGETTGDANMYDNLQNANDYLICEMLGMTQEQIDDLSMTEYDDLLKQVEKAKKGKA
jgi:hypothetical protein